MTTVHLPRLCSTILTALTACTPGGKTSATASEAGCAGADRAACEGSTPATAENACFWVKTYPVSATCEVGAPATACVEINLIEGGPSCGGFYKTTPNGVIRLESLDCFEPADDPEWSYCFPDLDDPSTPADPACACGIDESCLQHKDQATCEAMATTARPCSWEAGSCDSS